MSQMWQQLQEKFAALPLPRRKFWFVLALLFVLYLGVWVLAMPAWQNYQLEQTKVSQQRQQLSLLRQQLEVVDIRLAGDPTAPLRSRLKQLQTQLDEVNQRIKTETNYISAADNRALLQALLGSAEQLDVKSAQALPAERVYGDGDATAGEIYKHRLQLVVSGSYQQVFDYFKRLEGLPWSFYWQRMDYQVAEYPEAQVLLEIYTLSLERDYVAS